MSYQRLADDLSRVAERLVEREADLEGVRLAKAAERMRGSLARFERILDTTLRGSAPEVRALEALLESANARRALDAKALRLLAKRALGRGLTLKRDQRSREHRKRFLDAAVKHERAGEALKEVQSYLLELKRPLPGVGDRDAVLRRLWKLAALSEAKLEVEKRRLVENEPLLRAMAEHAYVKVPKGASPRVLLSRLVKFSRRVRENVS